jgi:glycosyltransferase involved in cell wall biosynthesis
MERGRRAVVLVPNAFAPYSRGLRLARALVSEGYKVEVAAMQERDLPADDHEGTVEVRRYQTVGTQDVDRPVRRRGVRGTVDRWNEGLRFPPERIRSWWRSLDATLAPADLYHACGMMALPPALHARDRHPARPAAVIYDVVDDWFGAQYAQRLPGPIRRGQALAEGGRARRANAVMSVYEPLAQELRRRWRLSSPVASVENYPVIPPREALERELIRTELGIAAETPIVLYQGLLNSLGPVTLAAESVMQVPGAVFVVIGHGTEFERIRARDREGRFAGRHHTLPSRHPDELIPWTASADVAVMRFRDSFNDRMTTGNKLWEALAAGTPVVATPEQALAAELIQRHQLGRVAAAPDAAAIAAAIRSIVDLPAGQRAAWRERISSQARQWWSWPIAEERYRTLVRGLSPDARAAS